MSKLKDCPSCGRMHRSGAAAKKCMSKKLGRGKWSFKDFGFDDPNKKEEPEKKGFDEEKFFEKLNKLLKDD